MGKLKSLPSDSRIHYHAADWTHAARVMSLAIVGAHKASSFRLWSSPAMSVGVYAAAMYGNWRLAREADLQEDDDAAWALLASKLYGGPRHELWTTHALSDITLTLGVFAAYPKDTIMSQAVLVRVPKPLLDQMAARVLACGYGGPADYIRDLVRRDLQEGDAFPGPTVVPLSPILSTLAMANARATAPIDRQLQLHEQKAPTAPKMGARTGGVPEVARRALRKLKKKAATRKAAKR